MERQLSVLLWSCAFSLNVQAQAVRPTRVVDSSAAFLALPGFLDAVQAAAWDSGKIAVLVPGDSAELTLYDRALKPLWSKKLGFRSGVVTSDPVGNGVVDVTDGISWRVDATGAATLLRRIRLPGERPSALQYRITGALHGGMVVATQIATTELFDTTDAPNLRVALFDSSGILRRTLGATTPENRIGHFSVSGESVMRSFFGRLYRFSTSPVFRASPNGQRVIAVTRTAASNGEGARISAFSAKGDTLFSRGLASSRILVPKGYADSVVRSHAKSIERYFPSPGRALSAMKRVLRIGPYYPPVLDVVAGSDNQTWLEMPPRASFANWLVLDAEGHESFQVRIPVDQVLLAASGDSFWTVSTVGSRKRLLRWLVTR
jgi:hypothetical protein